MINQIGNSSYYYTLDFNKTYKNATNASIQGTYCLSNNGKSCFYDNGQYCDIFGYMCVSDSNLNLINLGYCLTLDNSTCYSDGG